MAVPEEVAPTAPAAAPRASREAPLPSWFPAVVLTVLACTLYAIRLDRPAFFDNEGRYAAVAREMIEGGDFLTPHMAGTLFLNKPPLTYWLAAAAFAVLGFTEWVRLVSILAAAVTLLATCRLGARLYGERGGLLAGALLATTVGFVLEARTLRPDGVMVAATTVAILCWHHAEHAPATRRTRWLVGLYAALGIGMMAKGFVPVAVAGVPIGVLTLRTHGWRGLARLRPGLGLAVLAAIVLPWHVAVAMRHPGFAWDYVVNQHLLVLLDKKLPRDSVGDPLGRYLGAFLGRAAPWIVFVPLTFGELAAAVRGARSLQGDGTLLLAVWAAGVVGMFALAPSRLEHYTLPALPAVALLAAHGWERLHAAHVRRLAWSAFAMLGVLIAAGGVATLLLAPALMARVYWMPQVPGLVALSRPGGLLLLIGGPAIALAAIRRRPWALLAAAGVLTVVLVAIVVRAQTLVDRVFSFGPVAAALRDGMPADAEVVFEAPEEYQIVGGLAFYLARPITLLEVPGFVPPAYLEADAPGMFLSRADFARRWSSDPPLALVSDPQKRRDTPDGLVPGRFRVLARFGDRWVLANR